jgi:hypothetical protein
VQRIWPCPQGLPGGSQSARLHEGDLPNFRYGQGRPQFNASSSIPNLVLLRIQLKDFMDEQAKINKDTVTKFKTIDKVLENIDSKVTEDLSACKSNRRLKQIYGQQFESIVFVKCGLFFIVSLFSIMKKKSFTT